ncbi:hypothetical protein [Novosphingobium umbonatum]|nr:hypothetical protein [Novosphingobium umbonatum]
MQSTSVPTLADRRLTWAALALAVLSCLPVLVARYPQMSDYPAHLARYAVMLDGGRSADLARYYSFQWAWTGNLGVDILIRPFAAIFGLEGGGRVITGLIPVLTGAGLVAVDYALRRRVTLSSLLSMPFVWSPMMLIGLLNYALGQAGALWAFALWVEMDRRKTGTLTRALWFVPIGLLVWLGHISAWGVLGVLVLGYELAMRRHWIALLAPWPLLGPVVVMKLLPGTTSAFSYGAYWWIYKQAIWLKAMRDVYHGLDYTSLILVLFIFIVALLIRRVDARLGLAAGLLLVLTIAVPRHISGGDYADYRLITTGLMVCMLAVDWRLPAHMQKGALALAAGFELLRLMVTTVNWHQDSSRMEEMLVALDHIPQGARVASAVLVEREHWPLNHFEHIGAYAVVRRHALTNANFAVPHVHMLQMKQGGPNFDDPSQRLLLTHKQPVDLANFAPAHEADYLWYVGAREPDSLPAGAVVIWRGRESLVARLVRWNAAPPETAGN